MKENFMEADEIKNFRLDNRLTQKTLSELIGVSVVTYNRWENGKVKPSALGVNKLKEIIKEKQRSNERS